MDNGIKIIIHSQEYICDWRKEGIDLKSEKVRAGLLSVLFMGLGQLYNRQYIKGMLFAAFELIFVIFFLPFTKLGIHGIITLGERAQKIQNGKIIQGDHSVFLMVMGILAIIVIIIVIGLYFANILDAIKTGILRETGKKPNSFRATLGVLADKGLPYALLTPAITFILLFNLLPLIFGFLISFTNYSGPNHLPPRNLIQWVGLQNFINLFKMRTWSHTILGVASWTFIWALAASVSTFFFGLIFAVLINANGIKLKRIWRTIFILPWAMPSFISIFIMRNLFNNQFGPINKYLNALGMISIPWLTDPNMAKITCVLVNLWFGLPYYMALTSGVIAGIPKDLYESARIDGAKPGSIFRKITFPMVMFATAPLVITSFGFNFNNFSLIYMITSGNPVNSNYTFAGHTDILISWIYKLTLERQQYSIASTVFVIIFIIISVISIFSLKRTRSFKEEDMIR